MRKTIVLALLLLASAATWASTRMRTYTVTDLAVSTANVRKYFTDNISGGSGAYFKAAEVHLYNSGSVNVSYDCEDGVATLGDPVIRPSAEVVLHYAQSDVSRGEGYESCGLIAPSAATVDILGVRPQ